MEATSTGQLRALTLDHPRYFWSSDGGTTWHEIPLPAAAGHLWAELVPTPSTSFHVLVVLPDDRLLMDVDGWSDQTRTHEAADPVGLWAGTAWAHREPVATGAPFGSRKPWVIDTVVTPHLVTLYALTPDQRGVVASRDAGVHWRPVRAR